MKQLCWLGGMGNKISFIPLGSGGSRCGAAGSGLCKPPSTCVNNLAAISWIRMVTISINRKTIPLTPLKHFDRLAQPGK